MNTTTQTEKVTTSNNGVSVSADQLRLQLKLIEEARIAALPKATPEQMAALMGNAKDVREVVSAKELGLNEKFRLDPVQRATIGVAKAEHEVLINKPEVKDQAVDCVKRGRLTSFKIRQSKVGLTFKIAGKL